jgi:hypothetical protein
MAVQKNLRFEYQAKNNTTGLTDVKAQVYLNGVAKAVGGSAITLTEVSATNAPGLYELLISAATLTAWGVATGQTNTISGLIDSATKPASAPFREEVTVANADDNSLDIAAVKSDTAAIKTDLESGVSSLANILAAVQTIQNNAGFAVPVPAEITRPGSGSNVYRIPVTIYNSSNSLIDPDSNSIVVTLANSAGADRGTYLTGYSAGSAPMVRDSLGQYHIDLTLTSSATIEELIFTFSYAVGGAATARKSTTEVITDVASDGFALQSTLLSTQTTVNDTNTRVQDIQAKVNDGTYGLAAANTLQGLIKTQTDKIGDGTIGLAALKSMLDAIEGSGFATLTDSLTAISARIYTGGKAI